MTFQQKEVSQTDIPLDKEDKEELEKYGLDLGLEGLTKVEETVTVEIEVLKLEAKQVQNNFCIKIGYNGSSKLFMNAQHEIQEKISAMSTL